LIAVLRSHCTEFSLRENIAIVFTASPKLDLPPHIAIFLYRIVEESLRNVAKHSRASEVCVRISKESEGIRASIVDNGCGFKSEEAWGSKGLGLVRMRERAQAVGGQLIVRSTPGMHTRIEVYAPVKWDDPN
jgi:two-component system sensor histidine kinase UhpB